MPAAQRTMHDAQMKLANFEATHHIADINAQTQADITALATMDSKIQSTQADEQQSRAQLASVQGQPAHTPAVISNGGTVAVNPVVQQLQTQAGASAGQTAQQQYTDQHPQVIALKQQEAQLAEPDLAAERNGGCQPKYGGKPGLSATSAAAGAVSSASGCRSGAGRRHHEQRDAMNPRLAGLPGQAAVMADLQRNAQSAKERLTALHRNTTTRISPTETALSDVTVTQPATPGSARVTPNLMLNLLLGILLGAALAVVGAFIIDYLDGSIKDDREVEEELALPGLAQIPLVRMRNGVAALPWVRTLTIESFLQLVTSIKYASDSKLETLVVTSPSQGDGKSTVSVNVALAMAEIEPRVLLIDADLRRASIHTKLHMKNERGLSDVLVGRANSRKSLNARNTLGWIF